jgi:hypothetical protein
LKDKKQRIRLKIANFKRRGFETSHYLKFLDINKSFYVCILSRLGSYLHIEHRRGPWVDGWRETDGAFVVCSSEAEAVALTAQVSG